VARNLETFTRSIPSIINELDSLNFQHGDGMAWPAPQPSLAALYAMSMMPPHDRRYTEDRAAARGTKTTFAAPPMKLAGRGRSRAPGGEPVRIRGEPPPAMKLLSAAGVTPAEHSAGVEAVKAVAGPSSLQPAHIALKITASGFSLPPISLVEGSDDGPSRFAA
jgi:hypothetical protein